MKPYPSFEAPNKQHWLPSDPESDTFKDIELPDETEKKKHKPDSEEKQKTTKKEAEDAEHKKDKKKQEDSAKHKEKEQKSEHEKAEKIKKKDEESYEEKQERRQQLIERSLQYKKLYEEVPIPHDPTVLAKLLVAEHILALHEQIEKPKKNAILSKEELLDVFDYMGALSKKFENPKEESPPEIQDAYDNLLALADEALEQNAAPAHIVEANQAHAAQPAGAHIETQKKPQPEQETPASIETPKPITLPQATAALVSALLAMRTPKPKLPPAPVSLQPAPMIHEDARKEEVFTPPATSYPDSEYVPARPTPTALRPSLSPIEARQAYREATRAEHIALRPLRPGEKIAAIAVASALAPAFHHEQPTPTPVATGGAREYAFNTPPKPPTTPHEELAALTYSHAKPVTTHAETVHSYISSTPYKRPEITPPVTSHETLTSPSTTASPNETSEQRSSRKIEHLPLQTLLVMAEAVPIGYGQRLRRAYEKGEIDKDGLVKVLKSRSKNLDYLREFKHQSDRHRTLMQTSPEFLSSSKVTSAATSTPTETVTVSRPPQDTSPIPTSRLSESKEQLLSDVLSPRQKQAEETPTGWKTLLLIASGIIAIVGLIIAIFMLK